MLVSRRHFFLGTLAAPLLSARKTAVERPNVVLFLVDNLPEWMLACYGNKEVQSPNIQRLSDTGTRFLNHFADACLPALNRGTLLTGRTPMQLGESGAAPTGATVDKLLADAGYATHSVDLAAAPALIEQQAAGKPFAAVIAVPDLKPPYDGVPQKFLDLYATSNFESYPQDPVAANARAGKEMLANRVASWRKLAAAITALDDKIGAVTFKIAGKKMMDNTLVIFTSTCGALYGRHGLWGAGDASDPVNMYDEVVKTPMIWSWPHRMPPQGVVIEMTSAYDMLASLCDLLSLPAPGSNLCGRSYIPVAQQKKLPKKQPWRKVVMGHTGNTDFAREENYKVVLRDNGKGANELYARTSDPSESTNLYDTPEYLDVRNRLTAAIMAWKANYAR